MTRAEKQELAAKVKAIRFHLTSCKYFATVGKNVPLAAAEAQSVWNGADDLCRFIKMRLPK